MNAYLQKILEEKPAGLDKSVGELIAKHVGEFNGIEREALLYQLRQQNPLRKTKDRHMRISIQNFRRQGVRICHTETILYDPVRKKNVTIFRYYLAANEKEYQAFRRRYGKYAETINGNIEAMDHQSPIDPPKDKPAEKKVATPQVETQASFPLSF